MDLLLLLARRSWRILAVATATGLVCGLAAAGLIALINDALARFQQLLARDALLFAALVAVVVVSRVLADISLLRLGQTAVSDLRLHLSAKLVDTPYARLQQLGKHRLMAMLTDDTQMISQAVELVPILLVNLGILLACLAYLGWLNPALLLCTLVLIVIGVVSFRWPQSKALTSISAARELKDQLFNQYRALCEGSKELQLNQQRRQQFFQRLLLPTSLEYKGHFVKGMSIYALVLNWGNGLFYVVIGLVLFAAPLFLELSVSLVTGYILTILYMITPLSELMNLLPTLGRASVALRKIRSLEGQLASSDDRLAAKPSAQQLTLRCREVCHTYYREREDGHFTLGPVNLELHAGELVYIIGGNGGGKTTLALLLCGLYQPEAGQVQLLGSSSSDAVSPVVDSKTQALDYRQHFAAVFTDFCLFEDLLDAEDPDLLQKAKDYLVQLQLDHKVKIESGRLSTVDLSTGQRKRLALLSAYLEDRPCYLFDEWAADQDPLFKRFFYEKILPDLKQKNKLVFVITHDDAYFHLADRLIKVDQGRVEELDLRSESARIVAAHN